MCKESAARAVRRVPCGGREGTHRHRVEHARVDLGLPRLLGLVSAPSTESTTLKKVIERPDEHEQIMYFLKNAGGRAHTFGLKGMHMWSGQRGAMRLAHRRWMDQPTEPLTQAAKARAVQPSHALRFACGVLPLKRRRQVVHHELRPPAKGVRVDALADVSHEKMTGTRMRGLHARKRWDNTKIAGGTVSGGICHLLLGKGDGEVWSLRGESLAGTYSRIPLR